MKLLLIHAVFCVAFKSRQVDVTRLQLYCYTDDGSLSRCLWIHRWKHSSRYRGALHLSILPLLLSVCASATVCSLSFDCTLRTAYCKTKYFIEIQSSTVEMICAQLLNNSNKHTKTYTKVTNYCESVMLTAHFSYFNCADHAGRQSGGGKNGVKGASGISRLWRRQDKEIFCLTFTSLHGCATGRVYRYLISFAPTIPKSFSKSSFWVFSLTWNNSEQFGWLNLNKNWKYSIEN